MADCPLVRQLIAERRKIGRCREPEADGFTQPLTDLLRQLTRVPAQHLERAHLGHLRVQLHGHESTLLSL